ncbi:DUF5605 domain-containing protein [Larkinella ripae]
MFGLAFIRFFLILCLPFTLVAQPAAPESTVEKWGLYEISLAGPSGGNPFTDVWLSAEFSLGAKKIKVTGFYDGEGVYKIRFMPDSVGQWSYRTASNVKALTGKRGTLACRAPSAANHGPVKVWNMYHFQYANGKPYYPFGTTAYAWTHQSEALQEQTLNTLKTAPFNKIRMCVFPKTYSYVEDEPALFAYQAKNRSKRVDGTLHYEWDFTRFNPVFFRHLEKRIADLAKLNIEADLIIFHPYDKGRWGFDSMGMKNDLFYIKYLVARLSAYPNVWWSLANEFDFIKNKSREDWDVYSKAVVEADPFHHLCSIHNGTEYFDNWKPYYTHVSIQNGSVVEDFGRAVLLRDAYRKPVVYDEVCYEGNLPQRWGRLSAEEMTETFWQGVIAGTYVTHGETYRTPGDTIFWAEGGRFHGQSPARIAFLRKLLEEEPGPLQLADPWKDHQTCQSDSAHYLIYFGKQMPTEWVFNLPKKGAPAAGTVFKAELIDTWNMTITPLSETFKLGEVQNYRLYDETVKKIRLPAKPYLAIRLTRVKE